MSFVRIDISFSFSASKEKFAITFMTSLGLVWVRLRCGRVWTSSEDDEERETERDCGICGISSIVIDGCRENGSRFSHNADNGGVMIVLILASFSLLLCDTLRVLVPSQNPISA